MAIRSRTELVTWVAIIFSATLCSAAARQLQSGPGVAVSTLRHHSRTTPAHGASLCTSRDMVFKIEDHDVGREHTGWRGVDDFETLAHSMDEKVQPLVRVYIDGVPCEAQGCCGASILVRPGHDSDADILAHSLSWYSGFLKALPWQPQTILDAGANIGVASIALAHLYPTAQIVAVEPEPGNCRVLQANTVTYPNVHVECMGLWDKDASLKLVKPDDGRDWGWVTNEVEEGTPGSLRAVSVQSLLKKYNLASFEYVKLDIEGAEWQIFRQDKNLKWLNGLKLMSMEAHYGFIQEGDWNHMWALLETRGLRKTRHGEYDVWATEDLHPILQEKEVREKEDEPGPKPI